MFGAKKLVGGLSEQIDTLIGKETQLNGSLNARGTLRIDGKIEGDIITCGDIVVGETGKLVAQIKARNATVAGEIVGNMDIAEKLELLPTAKLDGDIKVGKLIIGDGAVFYGACEMRNTSQSMAEINNTVLPEKSKA